MQMKDTYQIITDRLLAILEAGTVPWQKPWNHGYGGPQNLVSRKYYQGINVFMLACCGSNFGSPYWLTYKQAQSLGGNVRKGENGTPVIFWKLYDKDDPEADNGIRKVPVLRYYTVFNSEQCDNVATPLPDEVAQIMHNPIEAAENVIHAMPNCPAIKVGGNRAYYSPDLDIVRVPELSRYEQAEEYYSTMFHELAHATGHKSRLNREGIVGNHFFGDAVYSREELIAEMTAAFLCGHIGIENATIHNSAAYIQSWINVLKGNKKLAIIAAAQAQKAVDYILNRQANQGSI